MVWEGDTKGKREGKARGEEGTSQWGSGEVDCDCKGEFGLRWLLSGG